MYIAENIYDRDTQNNNNILQLIKKKFLKSISTWLSHIKFNEIHKHYLDVSLNLENFLILFFQFLKKPLETRIGANSISGENKLSGNQ